MPSVDEIAAVDCPEFMLDIGEPCAIGDQAGIVTIECECIEADAVEVVSVEFINDTGNESIFLTCRASKNDCLRFQVIWTVKMERSRNSPSHRCFVKFGKEKSAVSNVAHLD